MIAPWDKFIYDKSLKLLYSIAHTFTSTYLSLRTWISRVFLSLINDAYEKVIVVRNFYDLSPPIWSSHCFSDRQTIRGSFELEEAQELSSTCTVEWSCFSLLVYPPNEREHLLPHSLLSTLLRVYLQLLGTSEHSASTLF